MRKGLLQLVRETEGKDLIEYALLTATIAVGIATAMGFISQALSGQFQSITGRLGL